MTAPVPPTTPLAILGGGQLGRMLALAAIALGVEVRSLDPSPEAPAGAASTLVVGDLDDVDAARATADGTRVVTYEWEGVPASTVGALTEAGFTVHPSIDALAVSQDRLLEKTCFAELGIPVATFAPVDTESELSAALRRVGTPAILKTRRGGYDGKGQHAIEGPAEAPAAFAALAGSGPLILERRIAFDRELSILAVRGADGDLRTWPLTVNEHRAGILRTSTAPSPGVGAALQRTADEHVRALVERFDYIGVLALELFQAGDTLLANEMAPRVHNSGHWTIEGSVTSQFENHVRAVLGWPLGDTTLRAPSIMRNCIGTLPDPAAVLGLPGVHLHRYGKTLRRGRKVGHVTVTGPDAATTAARLAALETRLPADDG